MSEASKRLRDRIVEGARTLTTPQTATTDDGPLMPTTDAAAVKAPVTAAVVAVPDGVNSPRIRGLTRRVESQVKVSATVVGIGSGVVLGAIAADSLMALNAMPHHVTEFGLVVAGVAIAGGVGGVVGGRKLSQVVRQVGAVTDEKAGVMFERFVGN